VRIQVRADDNMRLQGQPARRLVSLRVECRTHRGQCHLSVNGQIMDIVKNNAY
jgi:hypothetical protein